MRQMEFEKAMHYLMDLVEEKIMEMKTEKQYIDIIRLGSDLEGMWQGREEEPNQSSKEMITILGIAKSIHKYATEQQRNAFPRLIFEMGLIAGRKYNRITQGEKQ